MYRAGVVAYWLAEPLSDLGFGHADRDLNHKISKRAHRRQCLVEPGLAGKTPPDDVQHGALAEDTQISAYGRFSARWVKTGIEVCENC